MANALVDGLNKPDQLDTEAIQSAEIGSGAIMSANISGGQVNASHLAYGQIGTGSPVSFGLSILTGEATLTAGSEKWVVFGDTFKSAPYFVATYSDGTVASLAGSPITAGSVRVVGETASKSFHWIAIGSGNF